jgi:ribonuclease D
MTLITTTDALADACEQLRQASYATIDTEFIRESTYWPILCVAQIGGKAGAWAVDALAPGLDLTPLLDLLVDSSVLKVFHAGRQDVEIFLQLSGRVPTPMFDTQVAAMVCGYGESVSYETLVSSLVHATLDKNSRFTDWRRRPLTERQIKYALEDVIYLCTVYEKLAAQLEATGRAQWVAEEMAALTDAAMYVTEPEHAWQRIRVRTSEPRFLQLLRELAAWREREARSRDLARNRILKDEALIGVAAHPPGDRDELVRIRGVSKGIAEGPQGAGILEAVARALAVPKDRLPPRPKPKKTVAGIQGMVQLLRVLLKAKCEEHGVAQQLVACTENLEALASGETEGIGALSGWRRDVFGADAIRLLSGDVALATQGGVIVLVPLDVSARRAAS